MKQTVNFSQFTDEFNSIRPDNFSYNGLRALYDWFDEYEESCDTEVELDVIAICCDFCEYDSLDEIVSDYQIETGEDLDEDEKTEEILSHLNDHTTVIEVDKGGYILQNY